MAHFRTMSLASHRYFNCVRHIVAVIIRTGLTALLAAAPTQAADLPTVLVLPIEMVDTSGETPPRVKQHNDRLSQLTRYLAKGLADGGIYAVVDPTPIAAVIDRTGSAQRFDDCNSCESDLARLVHADRVLIGEIDKVSTLIGSLRLSIIDVGTGQRVFGRVLSFRGDTDEAWQHAVRFFLRDLAASAAAR